MRVLPFNALKVCMYDDCSQLEKRHDMCAPGAESPTCRRLERRALLPGEVCLVDWDGILGVILVAVKPLVARGT